MHMVKKTDDLFFLIRSLTARLHTVITMRIWEKGFISASSLTVTSGQLVRRRSAQTQEDLFDKEKPN